MGRKEALVEVESSHSASPALLFCSSLPVCLVLDCSTAATTMSESNNSSYTDDSMARAITCTLIVADSAYTPTEKIGHVGCYT